MQYNKILRIIASMVQGKFFIHKNTFFMVVCSYKNFENHPVHKFVVVRTAQLPCAIVCAAGFPNPLPVTPTPSVIQPPSANVNSVITNLFYPVLFQPGMPLI